MAKVNTEMFKAYDIRAKESKLTKAVKTRIANAISVYFKDNLKVKSVVLCRDTRLHVPEFAEIVLNKLVEAGLDVYLNPLPVSTCQFYYTCMQHRKSAGLMFTASHNPGEYVGIKITSQGLVPVAMERGPEGGLETVKNYYIKDSKPAAAAKPGKVQIVNELDNYITYSMKLAGVSEGSLKGLNIMFEFLNGSAGCEEALAFQKAGANVSFRHIIPNGFFPCGDPNPIIESSVKPARKAMKNGKFDLGFCFDGDGDRMDIMDCEGEQIVPSYNMSIIAPYIKKEVFKNRKTNIYTDVKALPSSLVEIEKNGVKPYLIRNGHSFIKAKLSENIKNGFFAAVEESAHYYICAPYDIEKQNPKSSDYAATESTLFYALLTARCFRENPSLYRHVDEKNREVFRVREWAINAEKNPAAMKEIIKKVNKEMIGRGAVLVKKMTDGSDLDASLLQYNLPIVENTTWFQIVMRISRSEDALMRCEISSNSKAVCKELKKTIDKITNACQ